MSLPGVGADSLQLSSVRVLVVDDVVEIRNVVAAILKRQGATVSTVGTADEALKVLQEWRPDALVTDIEMPVRDGFWLIAKVRALPAARGGETPAAALTGSTGPEDRADILRAGFQYHLSKPADLKSLVGVVRILTMKP